MGPGGGERGRARRVRRAPRPPRAVGGRLGATPRCVWGARSRAREVGGRRGRVVGISGGKRRVLLRLLARPRPSSRRRPLRASVPPPTRPGAPRHPAPRPVASPSGVRPLFPIARPSPPRPSRLAPRVRGWGGEGVCSASSPRPPPHPTRLSPVAPATTAFPTPSPHKGRGSARRGSSGRVWRAVRRGGRRLPVAGPLALPRRLPSPALGRSASAGRRPAVRLPLWACRAGRQAPRLPTPSEPRGFLPPRPPPPTPPAAVCPALPPCFRLSRTSDVCPLPAWRPAPRRSPFPPPSVVVCGGEGCPGTRVRVGAPHQRMGWGERTGSGGAGRAGCVRVGGAGAGSAPRLGGGTAGGWSSGVGGALRGRRSAGARRGNPLRSRAGGAEARVRPRARWGGRGGWGSTSGRWPVGRAVPLARLTLSRYLARPGAEV